MFWRARRKLILPMLLLPVLLYTIITIVPLLLTIMLSFTNWQGLGTYWQFNGVWNFEITFRNHLFRNAVLNSFKYAIVGGVIMLLPAAAMAWGLHEPIRGKGIFRYIIVAPTVISVIVAGLLWKWLYNPTYGLFNEIFKALDLPGLAIPWLGEPKIALFAILVANVWHDIGIWVLLLSSGLDRIPQDLPEAASVDGASRGQVLFYITLPLIWEVLRVLIVLWIVTALQAFTFIYVMTGPHGIGGPMNSTEVMGTYVFKVAFADHKWALACAFATVVMIMIFLLSLLSNRLTQREVVEF